MQLRAPWRVVTVEKLTHEQFNNTLPSLATDCASCNDDVVKPVKEQAENKIDGAVALIMAVGRAMLYEKEDTLSDHIESYGIRSL